MKQLQCNFTTTEQSKRLLELGVPADSADLFYSKFECETFENRPTLCYDKKYSDIVPYGYEKDYLPCWSLGRLIEIHLKCCTTLNQNDAHIVISRFGIETGGLLQNMYDMVGECALLGKYDFSKLEENEYE